MTHIRTDDTRIEQGDELLAPMQLMRELKANEKALRTTFQARNHIHDVLRGADDRLLVVIGPCSIHDPKAALDYGKRLKALRDELEKDQLEIVMRVYFEKPRTTVGWKGLINDPYLDNSCEINDGLRLGRKLLLDLNDMGLPTASEFLDMITPQYVADLMSWGAIGARTTESQVPPRTGLRSLLPGGLQERHRRHHQGRHRCHQGRQPPAPLPVGHQVRSRPPSSRPPATRTVTSSCAVAASRTTAPPSVNAACGELAAAGLRQQVMIDFSHANSSKQYQRQVEVGRRRGGPDRPGRPPHHGRDDRKPPQSWTPGPAAGQGPGLRPVDYRRLHRLGTPPSPCCANWPRPCGPRRVAEPAEDE
jgi:3-deoxy-7-phosphoheptulonate synthase